MNKMFDDYTDKLLTIYYGVVIPTIGIFGVIGNIFTLFVLLRYNLESSNFRVKETLENK